MMFSFFFFFFFLVFVCFFNKRLLKIKENMHNNGTSHDLISLCIKEFNWSACKLIAYVSRILWQCGSRPWDKGAPGHPDPYIRGGGVGAVSKKIFSALQVSVYSKNKGGRAPRDPPLDLPLLWWLFFLLIPEEGLFRGGTPNNGGLYCREAPPESGTFL